MKIRAAAGCSLLLVLLACSGSKPSSADAKAFIDEAETKLQAVGVEAGRADWIKSTYIIDDSEIVSAKLNERAISATVDYAKQATRLVSGMEGAYGKGKYCSGGPETCKDIVELSKFLAENRDPKQLQDAWTG